MTFGSGSIGGEAARRGLTAADIAAAGREDVRVEQAKLDEADLHELERAEYYGEPVPVPGVDRTRDGRGFLGRLRELLRPAA
jgi:hypothetical protein